MANDERENSRPRPSGPRRTRRQRPARLSLALVVGLAALGSELASAPVASAAFPGLVRVSSTSGNDSSSAKIVVVACPSGKKLVGTGAEVTGAVGEASIVHLQPNGSLTQAPTSLTVIAAETDDYSGNWTVTAYATCANPLPGLVRASATSNATASESFKYAGAACPSGKRVLGTGGGIFGGRGQVVFAELIPGGQTPFLPPGTLASAAETDSYSGNWTVRAYAICADPLPGLETVWSESADTSTDPKSVTATCPAGKKLLGAGATIYGDVWGAAVLDDFRPNGSSTLAPTSMRVTAYEEDAFSGDWRVTAYGICASQ